MTDYTEAAKAKLPLTGMLAGVVGLVFLLVGILGFIPGVTTNYNDMEFADRDSTAQLFGVFQVSILHNLVHLAFGVAGLALMSRADTARWYLIGGGVIYLILWIYGLVTDPDTSANFIPLNDADNWLHLGLGVAMVILGLLPPGVSSSKNRTPRRL